MLASVDPADDVRTAPGCVGHNKGVCDAAGGDGGGGAVGGVGSTVLHLGRDNGTLAGSLDVEHLKIQAKLQEDYHGQKVTYLHKR